MAMYLDLYHGRKDPDEDMDGWGFDGPIIGPLEHMHMTYMDTFRIFFKDIPLAHKNGWEGVDDNWVIHNEGLVLFQGNYYGDWSISDLTDKDVAKRRKEDTRINAISYKKYLKLIAVDNPE